MNLPVVNGLDKRFRLVIIPQIDAAVFPLHLSSPTAINSGGYILPSSEGTKYGYSPIDIAVAAVEAQIRGLYVANLPNFFRLCPHRISESQLTLGIINTLDALVIDTIAAWKSLCTHNAYTELILVLKKNAPLTFKEIV